MNLDVKNDFNVVKNKLAKRDSGYRYPTEQNISTRNKHENQRKG